MTLTSKQFVRVHCSFCLVVLLPSSIFVKYKISPDTGWWFVLTAYGNLPAPYPTAPSSTPPPQVHPFPHNLGNRKIKLTTAARPQQIHCGFVWAACSNSPTPCLTPPMSVYHHRGTKSHKFGEINKPSIGRFVLEFPCLLIVESVQNVSDARIQQFNQWRREVCGARANVRPAAPPCPRSQLPADQRVWGAPQRASGEEPRPKIKKNMRFKRHRSPLVDGYRVLSFLKCRPPLDKNRLKSLIALNGTPMTELRDVTCHMGSHSVSCYPTQVNALRLNPSQ